MAGLGSTVWQVEQDPSCRDVLARHWPGVDRFENVCTVGVDTLPPADLVCGGFPCQDVSSAGKGAGLTGSRSGLWTEFARIVGELRPRWAVVENVASGGRHWVDSVRRDLDRLGYETLPVPVSAYDAGACHRRARVFVVAHTDRPSRSRVREPQRGGPRTPTEGGGTLTAAVGATSRLAPIFVEWLMGFPTDWTAPG